MKRKIIPIAGAALILGILFDWFFFNSAPGLNLPLFAAGLLGATLLLSLEFKHRLPRTVLLLMPVILFFSSMAAVLASGMLLFFNVILSAYLLMLCVRLTVRPERLRDFRLIDYGRHLLELIPKSFGASKTEFMRGVSRRSNDKGTSAPIVRGILLSLPLLILFAILLSSADMIFQKYVASVFSFHINTELSLRILLILFVASLTGGAYALLFMRPQDQPDEADTKNRARLGSTEAAIVLGSVGTLFLVFILIQFAYFFGGSNHVLASGFTYAEYARRGFFELIAVAVLSLALIWGLRAVVGTETPYQERLLGAFSLALIIEVLVIMLSAHMRLSLYEHAYGFTELRLFSHLFIGWLAVVFVLVAAAIIRNEPEPTVALRLFVSILGFFIILNVINPAAFIARENVARFHDTRKIDFAYLQSLPEDSTPAISSLLHDKDPAVRSKTAQILFFKQAATRNTYDHWQSWNMSRANAAHIYQQNATVLEANKNFDDPGIYINYK